MDSSKPLNDLRYLVERGIHLARQGSFPRKPPHMQGVPYLMRAQDGLREFLEKRPTDAEAWRLSSQIEERLLNYDLALQHLERAISLSAEPREEELERLALLRDALRARTFDSLRPATCLPKRSRAVKR